MAAKHGIVLDLPMKRLLRSGPVQKWLTGHEPLGRSRDQGVDIGPTPHPPQRVDVSSPGRTLGWGHFFCGTMRGASGERTGLAHEMMRSRRTLVMIPHGGERGMPASAMSGTQPQRMRPGMSKRQRPPVRASSGGKSVIGVTEPPGVGTEQNPNYSLSCPLKGHDLLIKVRIDFSPWGQWGMGSGRSWGTHAQIIGSVESDEGHFLGAAAHSFLATVGLAAVISKIALPLPEGRSRSLHGKARNGKAFGERERWPAKERLG